MSSTRSVIADRQPTSLGRHRVIAKLGQGGMADVYLTVVKGQQGVSKLLVAKVLRQELAVDAEYRGMFVKEARVATLLTHRNLVQSFEVDEADGFHYITMEYLDGRPLHVVLAVIGREAIPLDLHVSILALALAGLHAAHEQKDFTGQNLDLVHRDVSPQNVFVTYDGEVKVVDFGVAKVRGVGAVTETGALIGKIGYMAPEQALSQPVDRRADVFAVGIMLWEALAQRGFVDRGDGEAAALRKRLNGEIPSPRIAAPDAPAELIAICERAIAYEPTDRFATAAQFEEALTGYLAKKGARVGAKEIAALVAPPFEKDRAHVRALIEEQLAAVDPQAAPIRIDHVDETIGAGREASSSARPVVGPRPRSALPLPAAVLGVALVASFAAWFSLRHGPAVAPSSSAASAATVVPAVARAESPRTSVRVRIRVTPADARLALDGTPLAANPFSGELPLDSVGHVLTATAAGYATIAHDIRMDSDLDVDLTLVPDAPAPRAPTPMKAASTVPPGRRPLRAVDERDPYAQ